MFIYQVQRGGGNLGVRCQWHFKCRKISQSSAIFGLCNNLGVQWLRQFKGVIWLICVLFNNCRRSERVIRLICLLYIGRDQSACCIVLYCWRLRERVTEAKGARATTRNNLKRRLTKSTMRTKTTMRRTWSEKSRRKKHDPIRYSTTLEHTEIRTVML